MVEGWGGEDRGSYGGGDDECGEFSSGSGGDGRGGSYNGGCGDVRGGSYNFSPRLNVVSNIEEHHSSCQQSHDLPV